jgi:biotin operon repressor
MSVVGGTAENICSYRVFRSLTQLGRPLVAHRRSAPLPNARALSVRWRNRLDGFCGKMGKDNSHAIRSARQRLVLCRLMIDIMRSLHGAYAPATEPFGSRLETFFIGLCVALGQFEEKPFSVAKIAAYMRVPRTTVIRRLSRLQSWGLIHRQGHRYYMDQKALNSLLGQRSYQHIRRLLDKSAQELSVLDTLPD